MKALYLIQEQPAAPAPGGAPAPDGSPPPANPMSSIMLITIMIVVMWFLLFKPQRKQQKERENMLANLKKNDHVVAAGGILGIVDRIKDNEVILKIDEDNGVRVRVVRSAISAIIKASGAEGDASAATNDKK